MKWNSTMYAIAVFALLFSSAAIAATQSNPIQESSGTIPVQGISVPPVGPTEPPKPLDNAGWMKVAVLDAGTRQPLYDAIVAVYDSNGWNKIVRDTSAGAAVFELAPGEYSAVAQAPGYESSETHYFSIRSGDAQYLTILLKKTPTPPEVKVKTGQPFELRLAQTAIVQNHQKMRITHQGIDKIESCPVPGGPCFIQVVAELKVEMEGNGKNSTGTGTTILIAPSERKELLGAEIWLRQIDMGSGTISLEVNKAPKNQ